MIIVYVTKFGERLDLLWTIRQRALMMDPLQNLFGSWAIHSDHVGKCNRNSIALWIADT